MLIFTDERYGGTLFERPELRRRSSSISEFSTSEYLTPAGRLPEPSAVGGGYAGVTCFSSAPWLAIERARRSISESHFAKARSRRSSISGLRRRFDPCSQ